MNKAWQVQLRQDQAHHPHQRWARHPAIWNGLQKANSWSSGRSWSHSQGSQKQTRLQNCPQHAEDLIRSHAGSPAAGLGSLSSLEFGSTVSVGFPVMIVTPLIIYSLLLPGNKWLILFPCSFSSCLWWAPSFISLCWNYRIWLLSPL